MSMENEGNSGVAVQEPVQGGSQDVSAASQADPTSQPAGSGAAGGPRTPSAAPGGSQFGDADLPNDIPAPRARDEYGRFASNAAGDDGRQREASHQVEAAWLTPELKRDAAYYGFSEVEAKQFETPERLQAAMTAIDRRMVREFGQAGQFDGPVGAAGSEFPAQQQADWMQGRQQPPAYGQQQQPPEGQPNQAKFDLSKYKDLFDEDTNKVLNELYSSTQSEIARQQAIIEQLYGAVSSMQNEAAVAEGQRFESEMDELFSGLPKEYHEIFGKGPIREVPPEMQNARREITAYMNQLSNVDARVGRPPAGRKASFERSLRSVYANIQEKIIRNQISQEINARRSQGISRPTARNAQSIDPLEAAARRADEIYRSKGFDVPTGQSSMDEI